jgi:hypothetical protein
VCRILASSHLARLLKQAKEKGDGGTWDGTGTRSRYNLPAACWYSCIYTRIYTVDCSVRVSCEPRENEKIKCIY